MKKTSTDHPALVAAAHAGLCLDFANTLSWRGSNAPSEGLSTPKDLIAWCTSHSTINADWLTRITKLVKDETVLGSAVFSDAIAIRETIFRIFAGVASGATPIQKDLEWLNAVLSHVPQRTQLVRTEKGFFWRTQSNPKPVVTLLAPVLWSAGDLLASGPLERIRQCANETCLWLFLDNSRTGARRWCSMSSCGNRAKAQRHYSRNR